MNSKKISTQKESSLVWTVAPGQKVSDLDRVMAIGKTNGWDFKVCGSGKMITSPVVHESGWTLVPLDQDNTILPSMAVQRLYAIQRAGIPTDGVFIGHEPETTKNVATQIDYTAPAIPTKVTGPKRKPLVTRSGLAKAGVNVAMTTGKVGLEVAKVGGKIIIGSASVVGSVVAGVVSGVASLILIDPTLNIVLSEPGHPWVQLVVWYTE